MNDAHSKNPLVRAGAGDPRAPLPFDAIRPEHVEPAVDHLIEHARAALARIAEREGPSSYDETLRAFSAATEPLAVAFGLVGHLEGILGEPALRAAYNAAYPRVSAFYSAIPHDEALWSTLKAFAESPAAEALPPTEARHLDKTVDSFRRHGADLPPAEKAKLQAIDVELAEATNTFGQHVVDATDAFTWHTEDESALAGLPASAIAAARARAKAAGQDGWRFTLQGPSMIPLMRHLHDGRVREAFYRAFNTRASGGEHDNTALLHRILELRGAKARALGYADISELLLERRMVGSGAAAAAFVEGLRARTAPWFEREHAALEAFRNEEEGPDAAPIQPWDLGYYAEKMRKARFDFDEEALRPYFEANRVLEGLFSLAERLFGVSVRPVEGHPTWHPDVKVYAIDDSDGTRMGIFYTDLYPRSGKRGGAWMRPLRTGAPRKGVPHQGLIAANLTPPDEEGRALLAHREVETLFHEFGHLLHHLLSTVEVSDLSGTNVAWDFVELPSQIMENWCWAREALDVFARHHETDEAIPEPLFERMERARTFRSAYQMMRQLGFAAVDLKLHREYDPAKDGDVQSYARSVSAGYDPTPLPDEYAMVNSFTHLFSSPVGYAAGYYSYKWAEVLDADAFTRFAREGIFSREVGMAFRRAVLERGDSRDPAELYAAFMGRPPSEDALFVRAGLAS